MSEYSCPHCRNAIHVNDAECPTCGINMQLDQPLLGDLIVQDDKHCFGKPRIEGTGIPVDIIVERFAAGESVVELAGDYDIFSFQIEAAIRYHLVKGEDNDQNTSR